MSRCKACNKMGATYLDDSFHYTDRERPAVIDKPIMDISGHYKDEEAYVHKDKKTGEWYCRECMGIIDQTARTPNIPGPRYPVYQISYEQLIAEFPQYAKYPKHPDFDLEKTIFEQIIDDLDVIEYVSEDALDHSVSLDELLEAEEAMNDDGLSRQGDYRPVRSQLPFTNGGGYWKRPRFE